MLGSKNNSVLYSEKEKGLVGFLQSPYLFGDPERIRTSDLLIRSQPLYPAELRGPYSALMCPRGLSISRKIITITIFSYNKLSGAIFIYNIR